MPRVPSPPPTSWFRRADQAVVGALVLAALVSLAAYGFMHRGARDGRLEVERARRPPAEFLVDINRADWPELAQLPGIGETLARRIVSARLSEGPFSGHDDLRRVRGIGPRTLERLRPFLLPMPESGTVVAD